MSSFSGTELGGPELSAAAPAAPADYPAVGDVRSGVSFNGGASTGTLVLPTEAQVQSGIQYGTGGTEFTGTLAGGGTTGTVTAVGFDTATSSGTTLPTGASPNTKSSYVELIASTAADADYIIVELNDVNASDMLVDIAVGGAGSEVIIAPDLYIGAGVGNPRAFGVYTIPKAIAAGSRIAARAQSITAFITCKIIVYLVSGGLGFPTTTGAVAAIGANTADSGGTLVDPGITLNTKGAYYELIASTAADINMFQIAFPLVGDGARSNANWLVDIAIGGVGAETNILTNYRIACTLSADAILPVASVSLPINIPSGTRISARAQCDINAAGDRTFDIILYGIT